MAKNLSLLHFMSNYVHFSTSSLLSEATLFTSMKGKVMFNLPATTLFPWAEDLLRRQLNDHFFSATIFKCLFLNGEEDDMGAIQNVELCNALFNVLPFSFQLLTLGVVTNSELEKVLGSYPLTGIFSMVEMTVNYLKVC